MTFQITLHVSSYGGFIKIFSVLFTCSGLASPLWDGHDETVHLSGLTQELGRARCGCGYCDVRFHLELLHTELLSPLHQNVQLTISCGKPFTRCHVLRSHSSCASMTASPIQIPSLGKLMHPLNNETRRNIGFTAAICNILSC